METYTACIDLDRAFVQVDRDLVWAVLEETGYPKHLGKVLEASMKERIRIKIRRRKNLSRRSAANQEFNKNRVFYFKISIAHF